jgi:hypothetical protein
MKTILIFLFLASFCFSEDIVLNSFLTPGVVNHNITEKQLRIIGYTKTFQRVPQTRVDSVFSEYKITDRQNYKISWLIPIQLGGTGNIKNLYPHSLLEKTWTLAKKEQLDHLLHSMVITGKISLQQAQYEISNDWIKAYQNYVKEEK